MKILFLSDNFPPEVNAPATRTYEHCMEWVKMGHEITVITCFPNFPKGKVYDGYKNKLYQKEIINGINVIRVWSFISINKGFLKRILDYISYGFSSFLAGCFIKTDLIIATSPQFFTPISGRLLSFFKNKPWIMEVRDLWPDSIVAVGSIKKKSFLYKILKRIEKHLYESATKIVVVTKSFKKYLINEQNIKKNKIGVFKNGVILTNYNSKNHYSITNLKDQLGLKNKTIISYIGTLGLAHGIKFILDSLNKIENPKFHFLFIGDGAQKDYLIKYSKKLNCKNFTFINSVTRSKVIEYISITDYALVNLKKSNEFKNVIPSKIFENIAMYKPILLGVEGESKEIIEKYKVGICYKPENKKSFLEALNSISKLNTNDFKNNCNEMLKDYNREIIAKKMMFFLNKKL